MRCRHPRRTANSPPSPNQVRDPAYASCCNFVQRSSALLLVSLEGPDTTWSAPCATCVRRTCPCLEACYILSLLSNLLPGKVTLCCMLLCLHCCLSVCNGLFRFQCAEAPLLCRSQPRYPPQPPVLPLSLPAAAAALARKPLLKRGQPPRKGRASLMPSRMHGPTHGRMPSRTRRRTGSRTLLRTESRSPKATPARRRARRLTASTSSRVQGAFALNVARRLHCGVVSSTSAAPVGLHLIAGRSCL